VGSRTVGKCPKKRKTWSVRNWVKKKTGEKKNLTMAMEGQTTTRKTVTPLGLQRKTPEGLEKTQRKPEWGLGRKEKIPFDRKEPTSKTGS